MFRCKSLVNPLAIWLVTSSKDGIISCVSRSAIIAFVCVHKREPYGNIRTTQNLCQPCCHQLNSDPENSHSLDSLVHVSCKFVDRLVHGLLVHRTGLSILSRMRTWKVISCISIEVCYWWRRHLPIQLAIQMSEHFVYIENQFFITSYVFHAVISSSVFTQSDCLTEPWWMKSKLRTRSVML
jgi:hypothetical protein